MNILVIGNGGREAAMVRALLLAEDSRTQCKNTVHVSPHSILKDVVSSQVSPQNHSAILTYIRTHHIELVVVGPELPLWEGLSDFLRAQNILVFGPSKAGAELECSKLFCKHFLNQAGIPTSAFTEVFSELDVLEKSTSFSPPWVVKVDGLAAGKGVYICQSPEELKLAAKDIFADLKLGSQRAFLEKFIPGKELSYLVLTNGKAFQTLPIAQDHKRIYAGDKGPNTGGMGTVAPLEISPTLEHSIQTRIVEPFLLELQKQKIDYRGVLYFGIIVQDHQPYVLEINARFGDPEAQVILPLIKNNMTDVFFQIAQGKLPTIECTSQFASCVVLAAPGYPDAPEKNLSITGDIFEVQDQAYALPAGVAASPQGLKTSGGRVLNVIGLASTAEDSLQQAYAAAKKISWKGLQYRSDIGQKVLNPDGSNFIFERTEKDS